MLFSRHISNHSLQPGGRNPWHPGTGCRDCCTCAEAHTPELPSYVAICGIQPEHGQTSLPVVVTGADLLQSCGEVRSRYGVASARLTGCDPPSSFSRSLRNRLLSPTSGPLIRRHVATHPAPARASGMGKASSACWQPVFAGGTGRAIPPDEFATAESRFASIGQSQSREIASMWSLNL